MVQQLGCWMILRPLLGSNITQKITPCISGVKWPRVIPKFWSSEMYLQHNLVQLLAWAVLQPRTKSQIFFSIVLVLHFSRVIPGLYWAGEIDLVNYFSHRMTSPRAGWNPGQQPSSLSVHKEHFQNSLPLEIFAAFHQWYFISSSSLAVILFLYFIESGQWEHTDQIVLLFLLPLFGSHHNLIL